MHSENHDWAMTCIWLDLSGDRSFYLFIYLFIYLHNFYHDIEKAKEKIDTIRDSTTEGGSKLSTPGPNTFKRLCT